MNELAIEWNMETQESIHTNSIRRLLLMVSAICLLGLTGCSSIDAEAEKGIHNAFIGKLDPQPDEDVVAASRNSVEAMPTVFDPTSTR